jgi:hypothetical protein
MEDLRSYNSIYICCGSFNSGAYTETHHYWILSLSVTFPETEFCACSIAENPSKGDYYIFIELM